MDNTQERLLCSGEHRLDPDQQRLYFGTFKERVILTVSLKNAANHILLEHFEEIIAKFQDDYSPLMLKISPKLPTTTQMTYLKLAKQAQVTASIVDEATAHSPYGVVLHTDHAVEVPETVCANRFPQYFTIPSQEPTEKKSFLKKLFG